MPQQPRLPQRPPPQTRLLPLLRAAAAAAAAAAPVERTYTVVKGDTLSAIGKKFGVNWRDIASLNQVKNPDLIHPGQVFRIPN
jgi:nucleoid-associated protein YgaU